MSASNAKKKRKSSTTGGVKIVKKKHVSQAKLKKKLDALFSEYIRRKYADKDGYATCYTCGKRDHWKGLQNGHFVSRQYLSTRFDEDNCRVQCAGCNVWGNGRLGEFANRLENEQKGIVAELYRRSTVLVPSFDYTSKIEDIKAKLKEL